ncbi:MAG: chorismate synthase [Oscillospiraceae bacterium]|nr:chorismate synthase [Oscillospiraceae bacterium]
MSSSWGNQIKLSIFGESHGPAIGVVLDGLPAGEPLDLDVLLSFMDRRRPGQNRFSTPRKETDAPHILSGFYQGRTTGTPLAVVIQNSDTHSADYAQMSSVARPAHADYTGYLRYHGAQDPRGGGHFSGRLTAPLVAAGGIAKQILARRGVVVGAHIFSVGCQNDLPFDPVGLTAEELAAPGQKTFPVLDAKAGESMQQLIESCRMAQDSVGGVVECGVIGFPAGVGSPIFDGLENRLASLIFGIPAVKGIEFGAGFEASRHFGSQMNDPFRLENGQIRTTSNHHGGILGGISSGMPILLRAAFKPTPSISRPQETVDFQKMEPTQLSIEGRHDPCVVPRAVPCVEAATALALLDAWMEKIE